MTILRHFSGASKKTDNSSKETRPLIAISLFSGGGGLDLGVDAAGFQTRCCVDIDPHSCQTLKNNKSTGFLKYATILQKDIRKVKGDDLLSVAGVKKGGVSLLYGGPPCQAFSVFGRRLGLKDARGTLIWEYARLVNEILPEAFILENVFGLKTLNEQTVLAKLEKKLASGGRYTLSTHEYELAGFGVPQFRKRIFIIGNSKGVKVPSMVPTHGGKENIFGALKPYRTAGEALKGLHEPSENGRVPNHFGRKHSERIIKRYASLKFGERDPKTRINKLHPQRPSYTIIVGSDAGGGKGHVHPFTPREVTPRESARMQTFPDFWRFTGNVRDNIRQVGNAVPPLFAALLVSHVKKHVFNAKSTLSYEQAVKSLRLAFLQ